MKKNVYLFELDSVRKTDEEILLGQKALFNEITYNGNTVVLTFNQFVDSRGFFSLLSEPEYFDSFIKLFENGSIKISQFGNLRTISQYLIRSLHDDKEFIYSALPIKFYQKRLTALVYRSLKFCDLTEIKEFIDGKKTDEELFDLFTEVRGKQEQRTSLDKDQIIEILKKIDRLIAMVLRLSPLSWIYSSPREPSEYKNLRLHNFIKAVQRIKLDEKDSFPLWQGALDIIAGLPEKEDNRSVLLRILADKSRESETDIQYFRFAEAIINLCYNYTCECSICNISKHYNVEEINSDGDLNTFSSDFINRLKQDWNEGKDASARYLQSETNVFVPFVPDDKTMPDYSLAVRITDYENILNKEKASEENVPRYEYKLEEEKTKRKIKVIKALFSKIKTFFVCGLAVVIFNILIEVAQNISSGDIDFASSFRSAGVFVLQTLAFFIAGEIISVFLSRFIPIFSLSDAISGLIKSFVDIVKMLSRRSDTYRNPNKDDSERKETKNAVRLMDHYESKRFKLYKKLVTEHPELFTKSDEIPLADVSDPATAKSLSRKDELFHLRLGMIYKSDYNMLVVDPAIGDDVYPYERVIPSRGNGVVAVTVYKGRFVLLEQYRHAIRTRQYGFPRGYSEDGLNPEQNVVKELKEELGAEISGPVKLIGRVAPDSGLSGALVYVYYVELDSYKANRGHEGIVRVVEKSEEELQEMISKGEITDGFTLSALSLLHGTHNN